MPLACCPFLPSRRSSRLHATDPCGLANGDASDARWGARRMLSKRERADGRPVRVEANKQMTNGTTYRAGTLNDYGGGGGATFRCPAVRGRRDTRDAAAFAITKALRRATPQMPPRVCSRKARWRMASARRRIVRLRLGGARRPQRSSRCAPAEWETPVAANRNVSTILSLR